MPQKDDFFEKELSKLYERTNSSSLTGEGSKCPHCKHQYKYNGIYEHYVCPCGKSSADITELMIKVTYLS